MELNKPPPGAGGAKEIVPVVLRSPAPVVRANAADALGVMLHGSRSWESIDAPVTRSVTLVSWLLLVLDVVTIVVTRACIGDSFIYARVVTWNYHPGVVIGFAVMATLVMVATAVMTRGLRRANLVWLRVWIGGVVVSLIAIAAMVIATAAMVTLGLLLFGVVFAVGLIILDSL